MKKNVLVSLCLLLVVCGSMVFASGAQETKKDAVVSIAVGFGPNIDVPYGIGHQYWAELLDKQSNGSMRLDLFPNDQLGSGGQQIEQAVMGQAIVYSTDASFFADLGVADMAIAQAPFIFKSWDEVDKVFNSNWWLSLEKELESKGIKVLAHNWRYGDRHTLTKKKVEHPQDFAGMKIRVPKSTVYIKSFEAIGATPTPLALTEVYTSLQQGVVDGLENPLATIYGGKYQEVAKYLLLDAHMKTMNLVVCGTKFFNTLSKEQQDLLMSTAKEAGEYQNKISAEKDEDYLAKFKAEGVTIITPSYEEFAAAAKKFYSYPEFSNWTPGLYEKVRSIIEN